MRAVARTMLAFMAIMVIFLIVSIIPGGGDTLYNAATKLIGESDIFKNWFTILTDTLSTGEEAESAALVIAQPNGILANLNPNSSAGIILLGFIVVAAKSIFESIIVGSCGAIFKNLLPDWELLTNALGIVTGLLICSFIGSNPFGWLKESILSSIASILIVGAGIITVCRSTKKYNDNRGRKKLHKWQNGVYFWLIDLICGMITELSSAMFVSTLCLAASGIIKRRVIFIAAAIYIVILMLDYIRLKYRKLREDNTPHITWRSFI